MKIMEINEKVDYVNPALPTKKDKRYLVTLQFKIRMHTWWVRMKINAEDQQAAKDQAYKIAKQDLKQAAWIGVKFIRADANLAEVKRVNATPSRVNKS